MVCPSRSTDWDITEAWLLPNLALNMLVHDYGYSPLPCHKVIIKYIVLNLDVTITSAHHRAIFIFPALNMIIDGIIIPPALMYNSTLVFSAFSLQTEIFSHWYYAMCMESCYWVVQCLTPSSSLLSGLMCLLGPIRNKSNDVMPRMSMLTNQKWKQWCHVLEWVPLFNPY